MPATTTLSQLVDIVNLSRDIAQLNLGYLGISVAILGGLGGVFVYFNIRPLQDRLNKQEEVINKLRDEADNLLGKSALQTQSFLDDFAQKQGSSLSSELGQRDKNLNLEFSGKIQATESNLQAKLDSIVAAKSLSLKEILLSETGNKILVLESSLKSEIEEHRKLLDDKYSSLKTKLESQFAGLTSDIVDLKAYKYDMEGKMGGIIYTIEAVERCLKDQPFLLKFKLEDLKEKIGKYTLSPELFVRLKDLLTEVKAQKREGENYVEIVSEIEKLITVESHPKI